VCLARRQMAAGPPFRRPRLTAEQQSAPPRSELMARELDALIFSPRSGPMSTLNALSLSPRNVQTADRWARHMRGENVPMCTGGQNAILRATALQRDSFGPRALQFLKPMPSALQRDNPLPPVWWTGGYRGSSAQTPHPPASPSPRVPRAPRPQLPMTPEELPADPVEEAAAARVQREVRAHQQERKEEAEKSAHAATIVQRHARGTKDRRRAVTHRDHELRRWHKDLQKHIQTRFKTYRACFRMVDADNSGACDRHELKANLNEMFNLSVPEPIMDQIINLADKDGDGEIRFAEFARVFSADDVLHMKNTLQAAGGESAIFRAMREPLSEANRPMPIKVYNSHFGPGAIVPSLDASLATRSFVPRGFPPGTDLAPPPRTTRLQGAFRLALKADRRSSAVWHPRSGPLALPAGKKSDVHQPLTLGWHPSQLGAGVDEPGTQGKALTMKWLGVTQAPL